MHRLHIMLFGLVKQMNLFLSTQFFMMHEFSPAKQVLHPFENPNDCSMQVTMLVAKAQFCKRTGMSMCEAFLNISMSLGLPQ